VDDPLGKPRVAVTFGLYFQRGSWQGQAGRVPEPVEPTSDHCSQWRPLIAANQRVLGY